MGSRGGDRRGTQDREGSERLGRGGRSEEGWGAGGEITAGGEACEVGVVVGGGGGGVEV